MSASTRTATSRDVRHVDFRPIGAVRDAWVSRDKELVVCGPAGTGKTRGLLELVHLRALKHPGSRTLLCRKTRTSLTQTALVTFDKEVDPSLDGAVWRTTEQEYRYPNGSVVVVGGLDREGQKVFSGQYDQVYVNEATELSETEWENLTTRLRNGRMPLQQILADCNPDRPTHWLKRRADSGRVAMLDSRHEDNPRLFDGKGWTPEGRAYLAVLDALTGPRRLRLRHGRWVQAEGVVYPEWDPAVHLLPRFAVPAHWPRVWVVDFGYTNPFVWQHWAIDGDGRLYLVRQIYRTKQLVSDHAKAILAATEGQPAPLGIVCDHDAEGRATLEAELKMPTMPAVKMGARPAGIEFVQRRLRPAGDGLPRLFVLRDSLVERDQELDDAKKPCRTEDEFDSYVWADRGRDEPVKSDDHGMDCVRYLCYALDAPSAPESGGRTVLTG